MSDSYFKKFPTTTYANTRCVDVTRRVVLSGRQDPRNYYAYELKGHDLPDTLAAGYYSDPYRAWMVYMSAGTYDPYFEWPLDQDSFEEFITDKYGSSANAKQQILNWRLDWSDSEESLVPSDYTNNVPEPLKKYYEAVYGQGSRIISYSRRREDWTAATNIIATLRTSGNTAGSFTLGERCQLKSGNTVLSNSVVNFTNSTVVIVQDVFGNTEQAGTLVGLESNAVVTVTGLVSIANCIAIDERPFWSPVYAYDYEVEKNEDRKFIRLLDSKYTTEVSATLEKDLNT